MSSIGKVSFTEYVESYAIMFLKKNHLAFESFFFFLINLTMSQSERLLTQDSVIQEGTASAPTSPHSAPPGHRGLLWWGRGVREGLLRGGKGAFMYVSMCLSSVLLSYAHCMIPRSPGAPVLLKSNSRRIL